MDPPNTAPVGIAALPLADPVLDEPGAPPAGQVFVYTHFAPQSHTTLSIIATNGDRCWRAPEVGPTPGAAPDWAAHLLFALRGPPPPAGGWGGDGLRAGPGAGCWEAAAHEVTADVLAGGGPGGVPPGSLRLQATWPAERSGAGGGGGGAAAAAAVAAAAPPRARGRVHLPPVGAQDHSAQAGIRAAILAAAFTTANTSAEALERLERVADGADARAAAAEARAAGLARELVAQQDALFAAAAAVVNEKKAALVAAEARAAAAAAAGGGGGGGGGAASDGWVEMEAGDGGGGGGSAARPPPPPPPPPDGDADMDRRRDDGSDGYASGADGHGGGVESGSSAEREAERLEDAATQPVDEGAMRADLEAEGWMDEDRNG